MQEKWIKWEPIIGLEEKYYIESVSYSLEGFTVILSDSKNRDKRIRLFFKDGVESYIETDETYQYKLIDLLGEKYGDNFYTKWTFFIVTDSPYIKYLSEQSYAVADSRPLKHFALIAVDSIMNIIDLQEPEVTFIKNN